MADNPELIHKLQHDIANGSEIDWLIAHYSYDSGVPYNETPITNFRNYRYKIVEIFVMSYKQEKAILEVELATPDTLLILGSYAEYKIMNNLTQLNTIVARGGHSWPKLLAMSKDNVRLLVNMAFAVMHLFAGDLVALSDNEIVYSYILAAAVIATMTKAARNNLSKEIQKQGLKRPQMSITDRRNKSSTSLSLTPYSSSSSSSTKMSKDISGISESAYIKQYLEILQPHKRNNNNKEATAILNEFILSAKRLSIRKACLQSLGAAEKDLPQVGRLLHLGRADTTQPKQLVYYIGQENIALPASNLGSQRYKNNKSSDSRSVTSKHSRIF